MTLFVDEQQHESVEWGCDAEDADIFEGEEDDNPSPSGGTGGQTCQPPRPRGGRRPNSGRKKILDEDLPGASRSTWRRRAATKQEQLEDIGVELGEGKHLRYDPNANKCRPCKRRNLPDSSFHDKLFRARDMHTDPKKYAVDHKVPRGTMQRLWVASRNHGGFVLRLPATQCAGDSMMVMQCLLQKLKMDTVTPWRGKLFVIFGGDCTPSSRGPLTEISVRYAQGQAGSSLKACFPLAIGRKKDKAMSIGEMARLGQLDKTVKTYHGKRVPVGGGGEVELFCTSSGDWAYLVQVMGGAMGDVPHPVSPGCCCLWCLVTKDQLPYYTHVGIFVRPYVAKILDSISLDRVAPDPVHGLTTCTLRQVKGMLMFAHGSHIKVYVQKEVKKAFPKELHFLFKDEHMCGSQERISLEERWQLITPLLNVLWSGKLDVLARSCDLVFLERCGGHVAYSPTPGAPDVQTDQPMTDMVREFARAARIAYDHSPPEDKDMCKQNAARFQHIAWNWQALFRLLGPDISRWQFTPWCHCFAVHWSEFIELYGSLYWFSARCVEALHNPTKLDFQTKQLASVCSAVQYAMECACVDNARKCGFPE